MRAGEAFAALTPPGKAVRDLPPAFIVLPNEALNPSRARSQYQ